MRYGKAEITTKTNRLKVLARVKRNLRLRRGKYMTDVNQEENVQVERDADGFIVRQDSLTFTVPKDTVKEGANAGDEIEKPFSHLEVDSDELAEAMLARKKWNLQELVNRKLKADARSNAYQQELLQHKPVTSTLSPDAVRERMIKDAIRSGATTEQARMYVDNLLKMITATQ